MHPRRAGALGSEVTAELQRRPHQGQPVRHAGRRQAGRHHPLGPHGHGAVGRAGLVGGPVGRRGARRAPVRPGLGGHEGLHRHGGRARGAVPAQPGALRHPPGLQLRRGGRLLRREGADRGPAGSRHRAAGLHRGRTHQHGAGDRAQGRVPLPLLRARQGSAFLADAAVGQCDRDGRAAGRQGARHGRGLRARGNPLCGLRRAVLHRQRGPVPRRHRRQRRAGGRRVPL